MELVPFYLLMMDSHVYRATLSAGKNSLESASQWWTMTWSIFKARKWNVLHWPLDHQAWIQLSCFLLAEGKIKGWKPAGTEDNCSKGLAVHHQGRNSVFMFLTYRFKAVIACKGFAKNDNLLYEYVNLSYYIGALTRGVIYQNAVISILSRYSWLRCI